MRSPAIDPTPPRLTVTLAACLTPTRVSGSCLTYPPLTDPATSATLVLRWGDAGWHRPDDWDEQTTPRMNEIVADGIELDRH